MKKIFEIFYGFNVGLMGEKHIIYLSQIFLSVKVFLWFLVELIKSVYVFERHMVFSFFNRMKCLLIFEMDGWVCYP
jgi:hypothetical protein